MSFCAAKYRLPIVIALAVIAGLFAFSPNFRYASGPQASPYAGDFLQEWLGGWIVRAGDPARFYDVQYAQQLQHDPELIGFAWNPDQYLPIVYPPFYYLIISPLSLLPLRAAAWIWAGLMTAALAASLFLLLPSLNRDRKRKTLSKTLDTPTGGRRLNSDRLSNWIPCLIPAAVLFSPVLESLSSSQKGTLCLLIFTATYVVWNRRRPFFAGMIFGLIAFKPQLVLVLAVAALWKRQWKFVAGLATTAAFLLVLSLCVGVDVCWQYVQFALGTGEYMQTTGYDLHKSHSIWGFAQLLMPDAAGGMQMCFSLLLVSLVVYQVSRILREPFGPQSEPFDLQFSGLAIATVLLSPHLFTYDLTILLLPMGLFLSHSFNDENATARQGDRWLVALLFIAPPISTAFAAAIGLQLTVPIMLCLLSRMAQASQRQESGMSAVEKAMEREASTAKLSGM